MRKLHFIVLVMLSAMAACTKVPEVNTTIVHVSSEQITIGPNSASFRCSVSHINMQNIYIYYGTNEDNMTRAEMQVYNLIVCADLLNLEENTTYYYYYEFDNGFNSMSTITKTFNTIINNPEN